jgi:hypothetical protein
MVSSGMTKWSDGIIAHHRVRCVFAQFAARFCINQQSPDVLYTGGE